MFSPTLIAITALGYVGLLFAIAHVGDRFSSRRISGRLSAIIYSLSLAVYCTSWTFFGAVGSAVSNGWLFVNSHARSRPLRHRLIPWSGFVIILVLICVLGFVCPRIAPTVVQKLSWNLSCVGSASWQLFC